MKTSFIANTRIPDENSKTAVFESQWRPVGNLRADLIPEPTKVQTEVL
jgi:hypothetical protein